MPLAPAPRSRGLAARLDADAVFSTLNGVPTPLDVATAVDGALRAMPLGLDMEALDGALDVMLDGPTTAARAEGRLHVARILSAAGVELARS